MDTRQRRRHRQHESNQQQQQQQQQRQQEQQQKQQNDKEEGERHWITKTTSRNAATSDNHNKPHETILVTNGHDTQSSASLDIGACSLCHCCLDYSDKAAFSKEARYEDYGDDDDEGSADSYYYRKHDPYLPKTLEDDNNALLYCDSCPRLYHQQCHFVPVLVLPPTNKPWECLFCMVQKQQQQQELLRNSNHLGTKKNKTTTTTMLVLTNHHNNYYPYDDMFRSPPIPTARSYEIQWECDPNVIAMKAILLHRELFTKFPKILVSGITPYKRAQTSLQTMSSNRRNRDHFLIMNHTKKQKYYSQELIQSVFTVAKTKHRIRNIFQSLEHVRTADYPRRQWNILQSWILQQQQQQTTTTSSSSSSDPNNNTNEFVKRTLFPFGTMYTRRWSPVTPEYKPLSHPLTLDDDDNAEEEEDDDPTTGTIPSQINVPKMKDATTVIIITDSSTKKKDEHSTSDKINNVRAQSKTSTIHHHQNKQDDDDDVSDTFSLDGLQCCVCLNGESSDENDMILCDGKHCYRAYHVHCIHPKIPPEIFQDETANWFCPYCQTLADSLHTVQRLSMNADEWEERQETKHQSGKSSSSAAASSLSSWGGVEDVFPEADWELRTAWRVKAGEQDRDTERLLLRMLGMEEDEEENEVHRMNGENGDGDKHDEDDLEEDGHFDPDEYEEERRRRKEQDDDQTSDRSSQVTLQELSSVELEIDQDELAALQDEENHGAANGVNNHVTDNIVQRRLRTRNIPNDSDDTMMISDPGKMNPRNILTGKRKRSFVDYRKLNDVIFGNVNEQERLKLDDAEEFVMNHHRPPNVMTKKNFKNSNDSDVDSSEEDSRS